MERLVFKKYLLLITYGLLLFFALSHMKSIFHFFSSSITFITPFIYGFVIAYLLNGPFNFFKTKVYGFLVKGKFKGKKGSGLQKGLSLVSVYASFILIITLFIAIVVPELGKSIDSLVRQVSNNYDKIESLVDQFWIGINASDFTLSLWNQFEALWSDLVGMVGGFLTNALPQLFNIVVGVTSGISNFFIGFVISIYFLSSKEKLILQIKKLLNAFLPVSTVKRILYIGNLTHSKFGKFIAGQLLASIILGSMCFIALSLFKMPYALLLSIILGITNIVPIVGPILGTIPTSFIVLMADPTNPLQAMWFILIVIVVQQIDSNVTYPRIIGNSMGLSGLYVLAAIIIGGSAFGVLGMLLGIPTLAVIYTLLSEITYHRLRKKQKIEPLCMDLDKNASLFDKK
jgi:predicted PurR-regulated permease PerM